MELGPIWRSMLRNKGGFILIAVQIAVTMTIMVNAIAIIQERSVDMARPSGLDEANTFALQSVTFVEDVDKKLLIETDLDLLRRLPGVRSAIATNSLPLRQGGWSESLSLESGNDTSDSTSAIYFVDEHGVDTFALNLTDGEDFAANQINWDSGDTNHWPSLAIVTQALAEDLFPDESGSYVGKTFYMRNDDPVNIIGLASFNVSRRTRQIGIRRALGATRTAIVRYFMVENFVVSTIGIAVGGVLAVALNMFMVESFALKPLSWYVIPTAMTVLWVVGQIAVAGPARKASNITPAIATRSI